MAIQEAPSDNDNDSDASVVICISSKLNRFIEMLGNAYGLPGEDVIMQVLANIQARALGKPLLHQHQIGDADPDRLATAMTYLAEHQLTELEFKLRVV